MLQLDAILRYAKKSFEDIPKAATKQQRPFEKMLGMDYSCPGLGDVRLMVGVRRQDKRSRRRSKAASNETACRCTPGKTCWNYFESEGIAGGDFTLPKAHPTHGLLPCCKDSNFLKLQAHPFSKMSRTHLRVPYILLAQSPSQDVCCGDAAVFLRSHPL